MMIALLSALLVVIVGVGILCYLVDVLIDEQRETNQRLGALHLQGVERPGQHRRRPPAPDEKG